MSRYYDKDGSELSYLYWAELFNSYAYRLIAKDGDVTTIWVGIDEMIFETACLKKDWFFYSPTIAQARRQHKEMVLAVYGR